MALSQSNTHTFASGELVTASKLNNVKVVQTDTATNNNNFTGAQGQLTYDTTNNKLKLHDGSTAGGHEIGGSGGVNTSAITDDAVTSAKIADANVTTAKIADDAVTLDKLNPNVVSQTGGLELGPNGLQLAVSEESLNVQLNVNTATGVSYVGGTTHDTISNGVVTQKFLNLADVYGWINANISSTRINVSVVFETGCSDTYTSHVFVTDGTKLGNVTWISADMSNAVATATSIPSANNLPRLDITSSSAYYPVPLPLWFANPTTIKGLHLNFTTKPANGGSEFALIRALGTTVQIGNCKITVTNPSGGSQCRTIFEANDGGKIRITNQFSTASTGGGLTDPFNKSGTVRAIDLDITNAQTDSVFSADAGSKLEITEFRAVSGGRTDLSGLHLVGGTGTTINITGAFINSQLASSLSMNSRVTVAPGTTVNCPEVFFTFGFNALRVSQYTDSTGARFPTFPGTNDFDASNTDGVDYAMPYPFDASNAVGPRHTTTVGGSSGMETLGNYFT